MKPDIFIHYNARLKQNSILTLKNLKQRLKTAKTNLKTAIETVLFYNSEIQLQFVRFRNNLDNINRF